MSVCRSCNQPLFIQPNNNYDDELQTDTGPTSSLSAAISAGEQIPDDLALTACECHFHWECLFDQATSIVKSGRCPACEKMLVTTKPVSVEAFIQKPPPIMSGYINEGGLDPDLDLGPLLAEEVFVSINPLARHGKALHLMAIEGDLAGILDMVRGLLSDESTAAHVGPLLRFQDPLNGGTSALHLALKHSNEDVSWMLLWLSSTLEIKFFPMFIVGVAHDLDLERLRIISREEDVRALRDNKGRIPEDIAHEAGFVPLLVSGTLRPPFLIASPWSD